MTDERDIEAKLWKALKSDRTMMLGLADEREAQPMTGQVEDDTGGAIWFFTSKDTDLAKSLGRSHPAIIHFAGKGHDLFASIEGELTADNDRATIERLWNPFVASWFEGGKDDPDLQLLRFDPASAKVWLNENSVFAGVRVLLGRDPKADYADKTAQLDLSPRGAMSH
ncbi:MAG TPA: pyridoxamine 5'-phosphate oxidase family protein [Caulobacteraceae bacterium]|jgi:general stress protein 26